MTAVVLLLLLSCRVDAKVFNRGFGPSFLVRLVSAVVREVMMLSSRDSVFFDSPLSNTGIQQVRPLFLGRCRCPAHGSFGRTGGCSGAPVPRGFHKFHRGFLSLVAYAHVRAPAGFFDVAAIRSFAERTSGGWRMFFFLLSLSPPAAGSVRSMYPGVVYVLG